MSTISGESLLRQLNWRYATKKFDPTKPISPADWAALEASLAAAGSPQDWLTALERMVVAATRERANHDNFTALTVWTAAAPASASAA